MHKHGWNRIDTFSFYFSAKLKCPNFYWGLTKLIKLNLIKLGPVLLHSRVTVASTLHCSSSDMTHTFVPQHSSTVKQFKKKCLTVINFYMVHFSQHNWTLVDCPTLPPPTRVYIICITPWNIESPLSWQSGRWTSTSQSSSWHICCKQKLQAKTMLTDWPMGPYLKVALSHFHIY